MVLGGIVALAFGLMLVVILRRAWKVPASEDGDDVLRERGFRNSYFGWVSSLIESDDSSSPNAREKPRQRS